jgi:hypothetical protein
VIRGSCKYPVAYDHPESIATVNHDTSPQGFAAADAIVNGIMPLNLDDKEKRNRWTPKYVESITKSNPGYNVLLIHTKHIADLTGVQYQGLIPFKISAEEELEYTLYIFDYGTVELQGDGGFLNWAFEENFTRNGNLVEFRHILG